MLEIDFRKSFIDAGMDVRTDNAITFAEEIERLGYGGLWHSHNVVTDLHGLDALGVLTAVAVRTQRIVIGPAVVQASVYHPLDFARRIITLDQLSNGRLILGVGTGGFEREFVKMDIPFKHRTTRLDETLDILQKLWTADGPIDYEGKNFSFKEVVVLPKPEKPYPKIVIGGVWHGGLMGRIMHSSAPGPWSERAITRIARYGDGWITSSTIPASGAAEILTEAVQRFKERAKELGRIITDDDFYLVAQTGHVNVNDTKSKAVEESEQYYNVRVARGFHQARGNPSLDTHLDTGACGTADEVAEFMHKWIAVKKQVPALKRIVVNLGSLTLLQQLRRFHEQVYPLIERELKAT